MAVRVTFIGSGNAFADGGRSHACIHVSAPGVSLLLDCGGSSLPAVKREIDPEAIDAIAISHLHGDHFGGIPYLVVEQHFAGAVGIDRLELRRRAAHVHVRLEILETRRRLQHVVVLRHRGLAGRDVDAGAEAEHRRQHQRQQILLPALLGKIDPD